MINASSLFTLSRTRQNARPLSRNRLPLIAGSFLLASLLCALPACASAGASGTADPYGGLGRAADPVPFMAAARTGTLPNGLRYYILENALPEN
ncbi:MAG: hypothetical protein LBF74_11445, partial [Treponema sp.]|nr:hypothetical protein [Treponema sp.]